MQGKRTTDTYPHYEKWDDPYAYPHYEKWDDADTYYTSGHGRASEEERNNDTF